MRWIKSTPNKMSNIFVHINTRLSYLSLCNFVWATNFNSNTLFFDFLFGAVFFSFFHSPQNCEYISCWFFINLICVFNKHCSWIWQAFRIIHFYILLLSSAVRAICPVCVAVHRKKHRKLCMKRLRESNKQFH